MAGGDGSQAIVAAVAAEPGFPTRASRRGRATTSRSISASTATTSSARSTRSSTAASARVDLAEVNGRVFVNNVSLGVYAEAVQRERLPRREAAHVLDTVPDVLGSDGRGLDLRWTGPDGREHRAGRGDAGLQQPLPPRPRDRLGHASRGSTTGCSGSRSQESRRAGGERGRAPQRPFARVERADVRGSRRQPVAAGIDGEALQLDPPLRFSIRSLVLRVRIAPQHPGASPSALLPEGSVDGVRALWRIAAGRRLSPDPATKESLRRGRPRAGAAGTSASPAAAGRRAPARAGRPRPAGPRAGSRPGRRPRGRSPSRGWRSASSRPRP